MANKIEYNTSFYTFQEETERYEQTGMYGFNGFGETFPDDLNKLLEIRVYVNNGWDDMETECSVGMSTIDAIKRWNILAPNVKMLDSIEPQIAVLFVEAIWLDTIYQFSYYDLTSDVESDFIYGLMNEANGTTFYSYGEIVWPKLVKIAHDAGVDSRIDAWLSGVPLEYILA